MIQQRSPMEVAMLRQINELTAKIQTAPDWRDAIKLTQLTEKLRAANSIEAQKGAQANAAPVTQTLANNANQAVSEAVNNMMGGQARVMQGQMFGTGGIAGGLRSPEPQAMAKGGAVAFSGEDESYVQDIYTKLANGVPLTDKEKQILATRPVNPPTRPYINLTQPYAGSVPAINRQRGELNIPEPSAQVEQPQYAVEPKRYRNVLPTEDITTPREAYTPSPMPEMQALTKQMLADSVKGVDIPPYAPTNIQGQDIAVQPQPAVRGIAPLAPGMAETLGILNQGATGDTRSMAERMQLRQAPAAQRSQGRASYTPAVAQQGQLSAPAQAVAQTLAAEAVPTSRSAADYINDIKNSVGENTAAKDAKTYLEEQGKEFSEAKGKAPWMALMQAGLATMAGTAPFALANIGAGAQTGLKSYADDMKDLRKEQDKARELQIKLAQDQRAEDLSLAKYGYESKRFEDAEQRKERTEKLKLEQDMKIAQMHDSTLRAGQALTAAGHNKPTEATIASDLAKATAALKLEENPKIRANLQAQIDGYNAALSGMNGGIGLGARGGAEVQAHNQFIEYMNANPNAYPELRDANGNPDPRKVRAAASVAVSTNNPKESEIKPADRISAIEQLTYVKEPALRKILEDIAYGDFRLLSKKPVQ